MPKNQKSGVRFERQQAYSSVGECIYCRGQNQPLGSALQDEHIIPLALGGNLLLPEASCSYCAQKTGHIETTVLKGGLYPSKERLNLPSRTKASDRPGFLKLYNVNGCEECVKSVSVNDYPAILILPQFPGPGIARFPERQEQQLAPWIYAFPNDLNILNEKYGINTFATPSISAGAFGRVLAKIAYSFAVAEMGLANFVSPLPNYILDDRGNELTFYLGTMSEIRPPTSPSQIHQLQLVSEEVDGSKFICCHIRLFASFGAPTYRVVVGQTLEDYDPNRQFRATIFDEKSMSDFRMEISTNTNNSEDEHLTIVMDPLKLWSYGDTP